MSAHAEEVAIQTRGRSIVDVTTEVERVVRASKVTTGVVNVFLKHTSASLMISENADPDVLRDLETFMRDLVPDGDKRFVHTAEGPDDMPAHVRAILTQASISVPVREGRMQLGTWQAIYLWEHRRAPHRRTIEVTVLG